MRWLDEIKLKGKRAASKLNFVHLEGVESQGSVSSTPNFPQRLRAKLPLPVEITTILHEFAPVFSGRLWAWVQVLVGAILAPGKGTVTAVLCVMGFESGEAVRWSSRHLSQILLRLLVQAFVAEGVPLVVGLDETLERRKGNKIAAKGIYRDAVRSSHSHFVKATGLR